jgi:hypothetical protein
LTIARPDQKANGHVALLGGHRGRKFLDMALKNRLADASYWVYDRMRHKTAFLFAA